MPLFLPVSESTELGRSLPRRVASATASQAALRIAIWFTPTGVWMKNVGMPVSWQIGASPSRAMSMLAAMIVERLRGLRAGRLGGHGLGHRRAHVRRQVRRSLGDQFEKAILEELHNFLIGYIAKCRRPPISSPPEPVPIAA